MKSIVKLILFFLLAVTIQAQTLTVIDENLENDWPLFRDRIIAASSESILFRMNESTDLNLYYSDGTNAGTVTVGYEFVSGFSGSDVEYVAQANDDIVLGVTGAETDILLFKDNSADMIVIASGLMDLEAIVMIGRNVFYAASKTQDKSNAIYKYNLDTGSDEEFFTFDDDGVIDLVEFRNGLLAMGYKDGSNQLMTINPSTGVHSPFYTFSSNPNFAPAVNLTTSGNKAYFWYENGSSDYSLYVTNGTEAGTIALLDNLDYYDEFSYATNSYISAQFGTIAFRGYTQDQNNLDGDVYFSNGTVASTRLLSVGGEVEDVKPTDFVFYEREYYFIANTSEGRRLTKTDGTQAGTVILSDMTVSGLELYNNKLFTNADFGNVGKELAYWDTNTSSIELAYDIEDGFSDSSPRELTATDTKLFLVTTGNPFDRILMAYEEEIMISTNTVAAFPISLSPNPVRNILNLEAENISYTYLYDMNGRLVLESDSTKLDLTELNPGSYVLKAVNAEGKYVVNKLVKL